jgi:transposase-like protein
LTTPEFPLATLWSFNLQLSVFLSYNKQVEGNNSGNSRNGYNQKTIISDYGESEIAIPRDCNGYIPISQRNRKKMTKPAQDWVLAYSQIVVFFADRLVA